MDIGPLSTWGWPPLYTTCTDKFLNKKAARRSLRALNLDTPGAALKELALVTTDGYPNGLTSDGAGRLYFAGMDMFSTGEIHRITLSDKFTVSDQGVILPLSSGTPNGVHLYGGRLYASINASSMIGASQLKSWAVQPDGFTDEKVHATSSLGVIDDFQLVQGGFLIAEYLGSKVKHLDQNGQVLHEMSGFLLPTSVRLARDEEGRWTRLIVSSFDKVSIYSNTWNVLPASEPTP
jgi:hypothetical protein